MGRGAVTFARRFGLALLGATVLASCSADYLSRRDTLSASSGNAVKADVAAQVVDPHPESADRVGGTTDGEYLQHAIERYESAGASSAFPTQPAAVPVVR